MRPYFGLRSYTDSGERYEGQIGSEATPLEYLDALIECTAEWARVLKPSGSIFVNLGDKYSQRVAARPSSHQDGLFPGRPELRKDWKRDRAAGLARMPNQNVIDVDGSWVTEKSLMGLPWRYAIRCTDDLRLILRAEVIWAKVNGLPESVIDRTRRAHEQIFHFTARPSYFSSVDEIREGYAAGTAKRYASGYNERAIDGKRLGIGVKLGGDTYAENPLGKLPGSVWDISTQPLIVPASLGIDHFAAFPAELPRRCILGWSPPAICVTCGEGRVPVSTAVRTIDGEPAGELGAWKRGRGEAAGIGNYRFGTDRRHLGYACACTPFTDHAASERRSNRRDRAPEATRPHGDYARKQAGEYQRVGPWREYHLDGWTPPPSRPAVVLDPFSGTGTTLLVADVLGRHAIGIDRSHDYCRLAQWRTTDIGERARAMQVPKPPVIPAGQDALFDLGGAAS